MSTDKAFKTKIKKAERTAYGGIVVLIIASILLVFAIYDPTFSIFKNDKTKRTNSTLQEDEDKIENGIHLRTGFVDAKGLMAVVNNCTNCHSGKLVLQNRMSKERWLATIKWMQETQNLWDLGNNQAIIVDYLVTNYPPLDTGRRTNLTNIIWYEIKN